MTEEESIKEVQNSEEPDSVNMEKDSPSFSPRKKKSSRKSRSRHSQQSPKSRKHKKKEKTSSRNADVPAWFSLPYDQAKSLILPLDILMFRGSGIESKIIRIAERLTTGNDDFSHIGIVVTSELLPHIPELKPGKLYVWESTRSVVLPGENDSVVDVTSRKGELGVQIRDLDLLLPSYTQNPEAKVAYCRLRKNPWLSKVGESLEQYNRRKQEIVDKMLMLHNKFGRKFYEVNPFGIMGALFPCMRKHRENINKILLGTEEVLSWFGGSLEYQGNEQFIFCSELVAHIYRELKIIPSYVDPANVVPVDFLGHDVDEQMTQVVDDPIYLILQEPPPF